MPIHAVLFDAVGTLIAARPDVAEVYRTIAARHGQTLGVDEIRERFQLAFADEAAADARRAGQPTHENHERERWRRIVGRVLDQVRDADAAFQELWDHFGQSTSWTLRDGVEPLWRTLAARKGLVLGVASNFDSRLHNVLSGLPPLCDCRYRFLATEVGYLKPALEFFRSVQAQLGLWPDEILLVGDDLEADVRGAIAAGWQAFHVQGANLSELPAVIDGCE